jgi:hypothetical protein
MNSTKRSMFDNIRTGDYITWSRVFLDRYHWLPEADWFEGEPDCPMEVTDIDHGNYEGSIEMECVHSCGNHLRTSFTRDEIDDMELIIQDYVFRQCDTYEVMAEVERHNHQGEPKLDFEATLEEINDMILEGNLPRSRTLW